MTQPFAKAIEDKATFHTIWRLAWPQMVMMVFHFLIGFADVWVAGRIGKDVQASMGFISQSLFFFLIIAVAVANGGVAAISQSDGAGLKKRVMRYVGLCLQFGVACSVLLLFAGLAFRGHFLDLMQIPKAIEPVAEYMLSVTLLTLPAYSLLIISNAVFRALKRVDIPCWSMIVITTVNTAGDFALGLGWWGFPNLGYQGLVWATFGSILLGLCFNLIVLARFGFLKRKCFPPLRWSKRAWPYLAKVAWPSGLMQALWQSGYLVLFAITAALPTESVNALAGMTAGLRIESILFLPAFAFNTTASVLVGHYLGAGNPEEAKRVAVKIVLYGVAFVSVMGFAVWQVIDPVVAFIAPQAEVQVHAVSYLFYNILAIPFTVVSMTLAGVMTGAGATVYTMIVYGASTWLVRLPLAYGLGHVWWGESEGVWAAMLISQIIQSSTMFVILLGGRWRRFALRGRRNNRPKTPQGAMHGAA